jgi:methylase of polypeptide subunit release factors
MDTFRLERGTLFYEMLERTYDLLEHYLEQPREENFPQDAYEFWRQYYAPAPNWHDLPEEWRDIAGSASNKQKVMFAVETVQSLLGRLMLAKACEDYDFPGVSVSRFIQTETAEFRGEVEPVSYLNAGHGLMQQMREELVESVFEHDIYYWWTQPAEAADEMSTREVREADWPAVVEAYGEQFVEFFLAISRFDFSDIAGDPLGELYEQYFDRRTRQALGEFYTPPSVCEYVVDSVGYGGGVQHRRLVDPACGSGTFLVSALNRYKQELGAELDQAEALRDLCNRARVVGFDIHPFAVVIAQIRFMLEILDDYKRAVENDPELVLRRLPVFRTDSLIDESEIEEGRQQSLGATYGEETIEFDMPLPIRRGEEFESMTFEFPRFERVQSATAGQISNQQEHFSALLAVFDAVKDRAKEDEYEIDKDDLTEYLYTYFSQETNVEQIASVFDDTAAAFLQKVQTLRRDYNDGRLLKLIEDLVLSAVLKNNIPFDYVVGNPPWVAKQNTHSIAAQERRLKQQYLSAWKETDPYLQFIERGFGMLREGGTLGLVVSNRFLTNQGGEEIRGLLAKNRIAELIDFTDYPVFSNATNYSAILTAGEAGGE